MLLAKSKLSVIKALIFKALIDSYMSQSKFDLVTDVLKVYNDMKEAIKSLKI